MFPDSGAGRKRRGRSVRKPIPVDARVAYKLLSEHNWIQPEIVARHYLAHAEACKSIIQHLDFIRAHGLVGTHSPARTKIHELLRAIKEAHLHDLGIALKWPPQKP